MAHKGIHTYAKGPKQVKTIFNSSTHFVDENLSTVVPTLKVALTYKTTCKHQLMIHTGSELNR